MHRIYKSMIVFLWLVCINCLWFVKPLSENLSYLGNTLHMRGYVLLWAVSCAICFYIFTIKWIKNIQYSYKTGKLLLLLSCFGMVFSVCLPYAPYEYAELSKWHVRIAMFSTALYIIIIFHILYTLQNSNLLLFQKACLPYIYIIIFDLLLYVLHGGVSTLLEITFPMAMVIYLYIQILNSEKKSHDTGNSIS